MADDEKKRGGRQAFLDLSGIGINMVVSTFIGGAFGYWLDNKVFGTFPWFSLVFLFFGIAAGFVKLFEIAKRSSRE